MSIHPALLPWAYVFFPPALDSGFILGFILSLLSWKPKFLLIHYALEEAQFHIEQRGKERWAPLLFPGPSVEVTAIGHREAWKTIPRSQGSLGAHCCETYVIESHSSPLILSPNSTDILRTTGHTSPWT